MPGSKKKRRASSSSPSPSKQEKENDDASLDYERGSVRRIKLVNFLTYDNCEFRPGPRLNLVIGPNGSGKSSIVCALALGMGGGPNLLGRASQVGRFVRHGKEVGSIEIELHEDGEGENPVVTRQIHLNNKSNWFLNGKATTRNRVVKLLSQYNVQVDNLCQFLPQDRVGDFSKFNDKELLKETVRAILGEKYVEMQQQLIEMQQNRSEKQEDVNVLEEEVERMEAQIARMERDVERMNMREKLLEDIDVRRKKVPWIQFTTEQKRAKALLAGKNDLEKTLGEAESLLAPLSKKRSKQNRKSKRMEEKSSEAKRNEKDAQRKAKKSTDKIERLRSKATECEKDLQEFKVQRSNQAANLQRAKSLWEESVRNREEMGNLAEIEAKVNEFRVAARKAEGELAALTRERDNLKSERKQLTRAKARKDDRLKEFANQENQRVRAVQNARGGKNAITAIEWLKSAERNGMLKGKVRGPLMLEVSARDEKHLHILEHMLGPKNALMFVTDNAQDRDLLMNNARSNLRGVSVINVEPSSIQNTRRHYGNDFLGQHGIVGYLDQLIEGDEVVVEAVRRLCKVHLCLVGTEATEESVKNSNFVTRLAGDGKTIPPHTLFTPSTKYTSKISKYSRKVITSALQNKPLQFGVGNRRARLLTKNGDSAAGEEAEALRAEVENLTQNIARVHDRIENSKPAVLRADKMRERASRELDEWRQRKTAMKRMDGKIKTYKQKYNRLLEDSNKDWREEEAKFVKRVQKVHEASSKAASELGEQLQRACDLKLESTLHLMRYHQSNAMFRHLDQQMNAQKQAVDDLKARCAKMQQDFDESASNVRRLMKEAKQKAPLTSELKAKFARLSEDMNEIVAEIEEMQAQADNILGSRSLLRQYEKLKEDVVEKRKRLDESRTGAQDSLDKEEELKASWEKPVHEVVKKISAKFTALFQDIHEAGYKCAGEVVLVKGSSYADYGVGIKVKFRENQQMQLLSGVVQSGGERSLSTFLYLLAMQELTPCPFRVVDEINQGMDAEKERLAFYRLVNASCRAKLPQYFLITPKLLQGLKYSNDITVHFTMNGPFCIKQADWAMEKFLEARAAWSGEPTTKRRRTALA